MTMVPRTGPLSASSAFASTSWYQRGKSSACAVRTFAMTVRWYWSGATYPTVWEPGFVTRIGCQPTVVVTGSPTCSSWSPATS
jgi:hypothetical protein